MSVSETGSYKTQGYPPISTETQTPSDQKTQEIAINQLSNHLKTMGSKTIEFKGSFSVSSSKLEEEADEDEKYINACKTGDIELLESLFQNNERDINSFSPPLLNIASHFGHLECVKYLVGKGAAIRKEDASNHCALFAFLHNHLEIVKFLLKSFKDDYHLLLEASSEGNTLEDLCAGEDAIIRLILELEISKNSVKEILDHVNQEETFLSLIVTECNSTVYFKAVIEDSLELLKKLIMSGESPYKVGESGKLPIELALEKENTQKEFINYLLFGEGDLQTIMNEKEQEWFGEWLKSLSSISALTYTEVYKKCLKIRNLFSDLYQDKKVTQFIEDLFETHTKNLKQDKQKQVFNFLSKLSTKERSGASTSSEEVKFLSEIAEELNMKGDSNAQSVLNAFYETYPNFSPTEEHLISNSGTNDLEKGSGKKEV